MQKEHVDWAWNNFWFVGSEKLENGDFVVFAHDCIAKGYKVIKFTDYNKLREFSDRINNLI